MTTAGLRVVTSGQLPELFPAQVNAAVRQAFEALGTGRAEQPLQSVMPLDAGGDVITYPSALHDAGVFALKVSPYLPQPSGKAVVTAWTLLMSTRTGEPLLLVDSASLTVLRTAATSALAVDLLAGADARRLLIVGAGQAARAHVRHVRMSRPFDEVRMYARGGLSRTEATGLGVDVAADLAEAVAHADVVCLCTSAAAAVVDLAGLGTGTLVTSISTNAPMAREVSPESLSLAEVYCDVTAAAVAAAGEMRMAIESGQWSPDEVRGDLPGLLSGAAPAPSGTRPVLFRSVGLGIEDAAVAALVLAAPPGS